MEGKMISLSVCSLEVFQKFDRLPSHTSLLHVWWKICSEHTGTFQSKYIDLISPWLIFSAIPKRLFWEKDVEICDEWPPKIRMSEKRGILSCCLRARLFFVAVSQSVVWSSWWIIHFGPDLSVSRLDAKEITAVLSLAWVIGHTHAKEPRASGQCDLSGSCRLFL